MTPPFSSPADPLRPEDIDDDARSIGEALRATLLFLAIVGFLMWAGVADARAPSPSGAASAARN